MSQTETERVRQQGAESESRLPFDRHERALTNSEAQESLRRQYGREVRGHADD